MAETITRRMTFEEFIHLPEGDGALELVNGSVVSLGARTMRHSSAQTRLGTDLWNHLGNHFKGLICFSLHIPTIPYHGRRPDIVYLAPEHVTPEDWDRGYPLHPPDLVIEVVSPDDAARDYVVKRREYASAGIAHYWIVDPSKHTAELLKLGPGGSYTLERRLGIDDTLTADLFPGLSIPLAEIFWEGEEIRADASVP